jgi:hypothetical protein
MCTGKDTLDELREAQTGSVRDLGHRGMRSEFGTGVDLEQGLVAVIRHEEIDPRETIAT